MHLYKHHHNKKAILCNNCISSNILAIGPNEYQFRKSKSVQMPCLKGEVDWTITTSAGKELWAGITQLAEKNSLAFNFASALYWESECIAAEEI